METRRELTINIEIVCLKKGVPRILSISQQ